MTTTKQTSKYRYLEPIYTANIKDNLTKHLLRKAEEHNFRRAKLDTRFFLTARTASLTLIGISFATYFYTKRAFQQERYLVDFDDKPILDRDIPKILEEKEEAK